MSEIGKQPGQDIKRHLKSYASMTGLDDCCNGLSLVSHQLSCWRSVPIMTYQEGKQGATLMNESNHMINRPMC